MATPAHRLALAFSSSAAASATACCEKQSQDDRSMLALKHATALERARQAKGLATQTGWHTHGTHLFAIPMMWTGVQTSDEQQHGAAQYAQNPSAILPPPQRADDAAPSAPPSALTPVPELVLHPQQRPPSFAYPPPDAQTQTDDADAASSPSRPALRVIVFHPPAAQPQKEVPQQPASAAGGGDVWWRTHPEYARWAWEQENRCYGERGIDVMLRNLDLARHVLARWDNYERAFKSAQQDGTHVYRRPPASYSAPAGTPVAELARYSSSQQQPPSDCDSGAYFSYYTWAFILMLVVFIVLAIISNWNEVTVHYPASGEAATAVAYVLMAVLAIMLLSWFVSAGLSACGGTYETTDIGGIAYDDARRRNHNYNNHCCHTVDDRSSSSGGGSYCYAPSRYFYRVEDPSKAV